MPLTSSRWIYGVFLTNVTLLCLVFTACSGGYSTSRIIGNEKGIRLDGREAQNLAHKPDQNSHVTIHEAEDPLAKKQVVAQAKQEQVRVKRTELLESFENVPKRGPQDPIYVNITPPVLDKKMQQAEKSKGEIAQRIRSEFSSDPVIQLVPVARQTGGKVMGSSTRSITDVDVVSKVSLKEVVGVNRKTGKPSKMVAVVFEATITSQMPRASYTVSESGHVLHNDEVSKRFARQVKQVILEKIGPDIPAH